MKYRRRDSFVEAIQFIDDATRLGEISKFLGGRGVQVDVSPTGRAHLFVSEDETGYKELLAFENDYIVKDPNGIISIENPKYFEKFYEEIDIKAEGTD